MKNPPGDRISTHAPPPDGLRERRIRQTLGHCSLTVKSAQAVASSEDGDPGSPTHVPYFQEPPQIGTGIYCLPIP